MPKPRKESAATRRARRQQIEDWYTTEAATEELRQAHAQMLEKKRRVGDERYARRLGKTSLRLGKTSLLLNHRLGEVFLVAGSAAPERPPHAASAEASQAAASSAEAPKAAASSEVSKAAASSAGAPVPLPASPLPSEITVSPEYDPCSPVNAEDDIETEEPAKHDDSSLTISELLWFHGAYE